ncbi:shikimate kinase [Methanospirillum lacunae]|uniref:Shikimate kinase n=1 Tax=Methanospirillum lacunae TaxID=668570 RepID=A0A2V2MVY7_9EURY|nr:shikimate kinase [Methanospirillum lacunae]PWR70405.1 shikimate kinase [Methanospirillum lacunae]
MKNIVLIGLPGAGKSTIGVILAKTLGMRFIDTDILIQENTGRILQTIINEDGTEAFLKTEEKNILGLNVTNAVIATGGSAVYSSHAMEHLKSDSIIVYLNISFDEMKRRLRNIKTRGVVMIPGQNLRDMVNQRIPLYEHYSDITIDCSYDDFENVVEKVVKKIQIS